MTDFFPAPEIVNTLIGVSIAVCLLVAIANLILAVRGISRGATLAFAIAFIACAIAWAMSIKSFASEYQSPWSVLLLNIVASTGAAGMWCGIWLRAGYSINWWLVGGLTVLWVFPTVGMFIPGMHALSQLPTSMLSIVFGISLSIWRIARKRGAINAGDYALLALLLLLVPVNGTAFLLGITSESEAAAGTAWIIALGYTPVMFTGIGLFTLLGFTLEAIARSERQAQIDSLTAVFNRRAFDRELDLAVARATRFQRPLCLVLLDVDHFKKINDSHGHPAGDRVLQSVAQVLDEQSRQIDVVARIGGEEFAVLLSDTPLSAGVQLAERYRRSIEESSRNFFPISASFGVASLACVSGGGSELLRAADLALYNAKREGRNRVCASSDVPAHALVTDSLSASSEQISAIAD
ncbi:MAG: GGDEF domain-containing protein [Pseudomonadota bacterium]